MQSTMRRYKPFMADAKTPEAVEKLQKDAKLTLDEGAAIKFEALFLKAWAATVGKTERRKDVVVKQVEKWNTMKVDSKNVQKAIWAEVQKILG